MEQTQILERLDRLETLMLGQKPILTFDEMCRYRNISKSHGYKETCARKLPYYKPDGKIMYFKREDVESYMLQNRVQTAKELQAEVSYNKPKK